MTVDSLDIITRITVELFKEGVPKQKLGTGVIYSNKLLSGQVYILTAKHCLSGICEGEKISLRFFSTKNGAYEYVTPSNQTIIRHPSEDAGIIIFNQREFAETSNNLPSVFVIDKIVEFGDAVTKGFPVASLDQTSENGESSLTSINTRYLQESPTAKEFQLSTTDDYSADSIKGMSGAGIFIEASEEVYINGIFTRYSDEERGKVIYAQRLSTFNELLAIEFKTTLPLTFLGHQGLGHKTFKNKVDQSIKNLGPRYCQKVNVKTGTALYFDCVAKTPYYYEIMNKKIDFWLTENSYRVRPDSTRIGHLEASLKSIRNDFAAALVGMDRNVEATIDFSDIIGRINDFKIEVEDTRHKLYSEVTPSNQQDKSKREFEEDEYRLSEISRDLYSFLEDYDDLKISLANAPYLIIKGEAGCGKSHMMGDVAKNRIETGLPTLLFLGTDFNGANYESAIISQTGFNGTFPEFLSGFNQIGTQVGSRALLMIDALNEGSNPEMWKERLSGLIESINHYPAIGLVVTVRDTYFDDVIPSDIEEKSKATIIHHNGFKGLEYEAVRQFCFAYSLNLPNVPILTPEFCNPLFLKIICDTLESSDRRDFPNGFNGISEIFRKYFTHLDEKFAESKQEYKYRNVVSTSVDLLAMPIFKAEFNLLKMQDADSILADKFPGCSCLLADLIDNNVLLKTKYTHDDKNVDCVVFNYQRVGDYVIAGELVKKYSDWDLFTNNIKTDVDLRSIFIDSCWVHRGVLEALAVLIPETYTHEVSEIIDYIPKAEQKRFMFSGLDSISEILVNSLNWRSIESIDTRKIRSFLKSKYNRLRPEDWYYKLAELSVIPSHPYNADYFHAMMMRVTMKERDGEFQFFFNGCAGYDDNKCANPLRRLIDWAWFENISVYADDESARLAALMLCWMLSSTYIKYRDEATKALVNLLSEKIEVLLKTMRTFEGVDDMYISERIYAVAYGVALRTSSTEGLSKLALYIYDTIFKRGVPPNNILLRDYARNVIEYAAYKIDGFHVNMKKVRPPYNGILPHWPTDKEVDILYVKYDDPDYLQKSGPEQNLIWDSIKGGLADFWNKLALPVIEDFYPIPLADEKEYDRAERMFNGNMKKCARLYAEAKARDILNDESPTKRNLYKDKFLESTEKLMTKDQLLAVNQIMIPFKVRELKLRKNLFIKFPAEGIRNWLVKRAYELGFDAKLHGYYDIFAKKWTWNHTEDRIDRIGKKYQWIAFYEVMGVLTDNYKFESDYARAGQGGYELYHGTWQSFLRNINPSMITRKAQNEAQFEDSNNKVQRGWWSEGANFSNWDDTSSHEEWTSLVKDLPAPSSIIQKIDEKGKQWLTLHCINSWDEPKIIGEEKYAHKLTKRDVFLSAYAILVKKDDLTKAVKDLSGRNLWEGIELREDSWQYLFNREKYWSPAYKDVYRHDIDHYDSIKGLSVPFMYSSEKACGHIERDKSGTIEKYSIPCRFLFEELGMCYDSIDGRYVDSEGNLIALTFGTEEIMIKKEPLIQCVKRNNMELLWIVRGEKRIYMSSGMGCLSEYNPCGVYYLDEYDNPTGELKTYKRV